MKPWIAAALGAALGVGATAAVTAVSGDRGGDGADRGARTEAGEVEAAAAARAGEGDEPGEAGAGETTPGRRGAVGGTRPGASSSELRAAAEALAAHAATLADLRELPAGIRCDTMRLRYLDLAAEADRLKDDLEKAHVELRNTIDRDRQVRPYEMSPEHLAALAERCELTWDMPSLTGKAGISDREIRELGADPEELDAINQVIAEHAERMREELRGIYVEITGDPDGANNLSSASMWKEIEDKTPQALLKQIFERLAAERAGRQPQRANLDGVSPTERMFRLLTSAGDTVERLIAEKVGAHVARRYRNLHNGFNTRWTSSYGCPKPEDQSALAAGAAGAGGGRR